MADFIIMYLEFWRNTL